MTRPVAARDNIRLNNAVPLDAAYVLGDRKRLMQVVSNLLSNAVKYNRRDGSVAVSVATVGDRVRLNIADTGAGLNDEQLARLYQPFERLGAEHGDRPGTGIGLVISKHLVQLMQGTIEVESRPGTGSVFTVVLRAAPQPAIDSHPVPAPQPA